MKNFKIGDIAPVLRGLTFDGQKGCFVGFEPDVFPDGPGVMVFAGDTEEPEAMISEFGSYTQKNGGYPGVVSFPGTGSFLLGRTPEEALGQKSRASLLPVNPGSSLRADTVRGKIAAVTGGAQGFGAGIVRSLVREGAFVFIADMNQPGAEALAEKLNTEAGRRVAGAVAVDVTREESVEAMMETILVQTGGLDLFVNNAGIVKSGSVKEQGAEDFGLVTAVNYTGYFLCTKYASRIMAAQNKAAGGRYFTDVIQINSKSGLTGSNRNGAYAGSKFGGIGLTQSFALELVEDNIKVNSICPGNFFDGPLWSDPDRGLFVQYLNSGKVPGAKSIADVKAFYESKVPMGRGCLEEDVVRAILYVVEQKYETGQAIPVTGGQVMLS